jgi:hypothetical protein
MVTVSKLKMMSTKARIQKGNDRIAKLYLRLVQQYSHVPNLIVFPAYGWGTGIDILVTNGTNGILELREVTNFDRFTRNGQPIYINNRRAQNLIRSLTKPLYWKWVIGNSSKSRKRFYPNANTQRFLDISYETNLLPPHYPLFKTRGITVNILDRTDYRLGYGMEDGKGTKTYFFENGQQALSKKQIM